MKRSILFISLVIFASRSLSVDRSIYNLTVPSDLAAKQMQFTVRHRFFGDAFEEPFETFFGMQFGANVGLESRLGLGRGFDFKVGYQFNHKEYIVGVGYNMPSNLPIIIRADVQYFSYRPTFFEREKGIYGLLSAQANPLGERIVPSFNLGYDSFLEEIGFGMGLELILSKKWSVIGEYFPLLNSDDSFRKDSFAFGLRLNTYGHQFVLALSNNYEIGSRHLSRGSLDNDLHIGFVIHRLIDL